ncbi:MAG TPA: hypothetical protein VHG32_00055 [Thermoanaerobaculia bacterium]|jgi:hypothetical protein|nr:hypothetical protein [Thermoanaerobaculia bacterium]
MAMVATPRYSGGGSGGGGGGTILRCSLCGKMFLESQREEAEAHVRTVHPESLKTKVTCKLCNAALPDASPEELLEHLAKRHPEILEELRLQSGAPKVARAQRHSSVQAASPSGSAPRRKPGIWGWWKSR